MPKELSAQRNIALHASDEHFFVAVKPPFEEGGGGYDLLDFMAVRVHYLAEGSQIFVFNKSGFGESPENQERGLTEFVYSVTKPLGIMPDVEIHPIEIAREAA